MNDTPLTAAEQQQLDNAQKFLMLAEQITMQSGRCPSAQTIAQVQVARQTIERLEGREGVKSGK